MTKQTLTLVTDIKFNDEGEQELVTKDYVLPMFIKGGTVKQALKLGKELEAIEDDAIPEEQLVDKLAQFASDAFGGQFTKDEAIDGLDARDLFETLSSVIGMVMAREEDEAQKKDFIQKKMN